MNAITALSPAVLAAGRPGRLQLVLRLAAGQGVQHLAHLFGLNTDALARRLGAEPLRRLALALQALCPLPRELCRDRLAQRADELLRAALAAGRAGAARFVERSQARGLVPAEVVAGMAMRLLRRVELVSDRPPRPRTRRPRLPSAPVAVDAAQARADSLADRFALQLRREALIAEGQAQISPNRRTTGPEEMLPAFEPPRDLAPPPEPRAEAAPEPSRDPGPRPHPPAAREPPTEPAPPVDHGPYPRNATELAAYEGPYDPDDPPWEQAEWEWTFGALWNPGDPLPDLFDEEGVADDPPEPEPEPPPSEDEARIDLAFLDAAVFYRCGHVPTRTAHRDHLRDGLLAMAGPRWTTQQQLGRAIRSDLWWPMAPGWKHYLPEHPRTIPPEIRATLPG